MTEFFYALASHNRARDYQHIQVVPVAGSLGADVTGVDLNRLNTAGFAELRTALLDHQVLFIREQQLSVAQLEAVTLQFGGFGREPFVQTMAEHPHVIHVLKEADEKAPFVFGGAWHTDWSFQARPPAFTLLYGADIPAFGGDTLYANLCQAYDWLSPKMQELLAGLNALHSPERGYGPSARHNDLLENMHVRYGNVDDELRAHPLITRHPETGRKVLFVNPTYTVGIEGLSAAEAQPLLSYLFNLPTAPAFTCRMRWSKGTLAIWDNRCTWHQPIADYHGARREMYRTTVVGEAPSR
jgi:taurine dioxygenase